MIFWINVARLRKLIFLHFGYEPEAKNVDQSPFHGNEAGSKECNTLALKGVPKVPLLENHAATRERWSLSSVTDSCIQRVQREELPGFELMFKAEGKELEARLQRFVAEKNLPFRVSVVTGPSGSYKEHDILNFLEWYLGTWGPGSNWELFFLVAYAPGLTDNVQRACWLKGKVLLTHGGGASSVGQTNDTDLHLWTRKRLIEHQQEQMIRKARVAGGGMVDLTREENMNIMIEVMSDTELHMRARRGYKYTGTQVALDGSEDHKVCREAKEFWTEMNMRTRINSAVAEVDAQFQAGKLPWTWATVQSLITPFPKKGQLDVVLPGQEDEATEDPDGVPWDVEDKEVEKEGEEELEAENEDEFDPADWHESHIPDAEAKPGHSDSDALHGGGVGLSAEQADVVIEQSGRVQALQEAKKNPCRCKRFAGSFSHHHCESSDAYGNEKVQPAKQHRSGSAT